MTRRCWGVPLTVQSPGSRGHLVAPGEPVGAGALAGTPVENRLENRRLGRGQAGPDQPGEGNVPAWATKGPLLFQPIRTASAGLMNGKEGAALYQGL